MELYTKTIEQIISNLLVNTHEAQVLKDKLIKKNVITWIILLTN